MPSKVLITGGTGFIGSNLAERLAQEPEKYELKILSRSLGFDITKDKIPNEVEADKVIHLAAALNGSGQDIFNVNITGLLNVLNFCREKKAGLIFASSAAVYENSESGAKEESVLRPKSIYGLTKMLGESLCNFYSDNFGVNVKILRIFNVYGPGQKGDLLIPRILSQLSGDEIIVRNPDDKRDFVNIKDVVEAIVRSLEVDGSLTLNIGSGNCVSIREIAQKIAFGKKINFITHDLEKSTSLADISKAREVLNWEPKVSLDDGIIEILNSIESLNLSPE